jgi:hypothetical protein
MKKIRTSLSLIETAAREKWIRQLAFYHLLKSHYCNSCIYNYKSRMEEIAAKCQVSTKTLYSYMNFLRRKGLIFDHNKNLILKSTREFGKKKYLIFIDSEYSLADIADILYGKILEKEGRNKHIRYPLKRQKGMTRLRTCGVKISSALQWVTAKLVLSLRFQKIKHSE